MSTLLDEPLSRTQHGPAERLRTTMAAVAQSVSSGSALAHFDPPKNRRPPMRLGRKEHS